MTRIPAEAEISVHSAPQTQADADLKLKISPDELLAALEADPAAATLRNAWRALQSSFPDLDLSGVLRNALQKDNATAFHNYFFWHVIRTQPDLAKAFSISGCNVKKMPENCSFGQADIVKALLKVCGFFFREIFARCHDLNPHFIDPDAEVIIRQIDYALRGASLNLTFEEIFKRVLDERQDFSEVSGLLLENFVDLLNLGSQAAPDYKPQNSGDFQKRSFYLRIVRLCKDILPKAVLERSVQEIAEVEEEKVEKVVQKLKSDTGDTVRTVAAVKKSPPPLPPATPRPVSGTPSVPPEKPLCDYGIISLEELAAELAEGEGEFISPENPFGINHRHAFDVFLAELRFPGNSFLSRIFGIKQLFGKPAQRRLPGFSQTLQQSRSEIPNGNFGDFISSVIAPAYMKESGGARTVVDVSGGLVSPFAQGFILASMDRKNPPRARTAMAVSERCNFSVLAHESAESNATISYSREVLREIERWTEADDLYILALQIKLLGLKYFPNLRFAFLQKISRSDSDREFLFSHFGHDLDVLFFRIDPKSGEFYPFTPSFEPFLEMNGVNNAIGKILKFKAQKGDLAIMVSGVMASYLSAQGGPTFISSEILNPKNYSPQRMPLARQLQLRLGSWLQNEKAGKESLQRTSGGALIVQM